MRSHVKGLAQRFAYVGTLVRGAGVRAFQRRLSSGWRWLGPVEEHREGKVPATVA